MSVPDPPLLLITDRRQARGPLSVILDAAFAAGCRWASLREKDLPTDAQVSLMQRLIPVATRHGARLTLHGDAALAAAAGADGVHLSAGRDPAAARSVLGAQALVGLSIHGAEETRQLDPQGVSYVVIGPIFETASKPGYGPALGAAGLREVVTASKIPVIALGGITPANAAEVLRAGAAGIAVMGGVMRADDAGAEVKALLTAMTPRASVSA